LTYIIASWGVEAGCLSNQCCDFHHHLEKNIHP